MNHPGIQADKTPDKPAYIMASTGEVVSYRELNERSNQGAQLFRSLGLQLQPPPVQSYLQQASPAVVISGLSV